MEDEINLLDYWRVIVKRKWLIIWIALITVFCVKAYTITMSIFQVKLYSASSTLMLVDNSAGGLVATALAGVPFFGGGGGSSTSNKLIPILESSALARQVAASLNIQEYFPQKYFPKLTLQSTNEAKLLESAAKILRRRLKTETSKDGLLIVSVSWQEPTQAVELINCYVKELGKFLSEKSLNINFNVLDPAVEAEPVLEKRMRASIAGLFGIFFGFFVAFFLEYLEKIQRNS